ncbi:UvrB/UvrC motif-containing protein [Acetivibrio cellulolyticus]|uniref:UvrB/UvrC motif-containing protein n=1 Tax=Acetivibrio cellulolyticus TaxID=35830 RepID=UPI0001E2DE0C|nr:UvrB/UvrC motif-containing protein [Acetivibrio cellulolyticus]
MLCQNCQKRVANIQVTQVINNAKNVIYLCEQCARDEGKIIIGSPLSVNDFFSGLIGFPVRPSVAEQQLVCDKCGMSYEEFKKIGKLGCENCYQVYGDKLMPILKRLHGNLQYHGKVPKKVYETVKVSKEIDSLKEQLDKAVKSEEYEKAAEIRDKIRALESSAS